MTWIPDICIYHFPCDDGFAAAWVARRKWPDILLVPTNYGLPFPDVTIAGKNLLIVDFSYKRVVLEDLASRAASIVVLDHHKTADAELKNFATYGPAKFTAGGTDSTFEAIAAQGMPPIAAHFDQQRSGAALTWEFCFPKEPVPKLIRLVEDRDLWRFAMANSRAFSLLLRSYDYDFNVWDEIEGSLTDEPAICAVEMGAIQRFHDRRVAEIVETATLRKLAGFEAVPVAHAPYSFVSDVAHQLLKKNPAAPFAAVIVDSHGERTWSLRSDDGREDVSEIAKRFGGGGHRNAAGFRVPV